jgi:uncharacterized membrane protein YbhN (UPF0104 family)
LRRRTLFYLAQGTHWLLHRVLPHRTPPRTHIWRYQFNLNRGIQFLLSRKRQMISPSVYILLDWVFTILIIYAAFYAVHHPVRLSFVIVGFAVGMVLSTLFPAGSASWRGPWRQSSPALASHSRSRSSPWWSIGSRTT